MEMQQVPVIPDIKILKKYLRPLYIINDLQKSYSTYENHMKEIQYIVRACFVFKPCREYPIRFKFYKEDSKLHTIQLRRFLYNTYLWYPFCELNDIHVLDESFILNEKDIPNLSDYINEKIIKCLRVHAVKQKIINRTTSTVNHYLRSVSLDFSDLMNLTFSDVDFFKMWEDPEYRELMSYKSPEGAQPAEIEEKINSYQKRFITKLKADMNNPLGQILRSGTGLKEKQLVELFIAQGMKPSLNNEVMPYSIDNSGLIGGLDRPSYMLIDGTAARIPLILNFTKMGDAGYFGLNLNKLLMTLSLSKRVTMCDSEHLIPYTIKSKKHLRLLIGKYFKTSLDDDDFIILKSDDTDLIGSTIYCKSAITCSCSENKICSSCIGANASLLFDISNGIGAFFTEEVTKRFEQDILSSKHILSTDSEKIEFSETFYEYFTLNTNEVNITTKNNMDLEDIALYVDLSNIMKVEEYDNDSTYNTYIKNGTFQIVNMKTGESIDVSIKNDKELYIVSDAMSMLKENNGYIYFKDISEDDPIFAIIILNNALTKPLYDLKHLLNREEKDMDVVTIETVAQRMLDIFVEARFGVPIVASEMIINRLTRLKSNVMKRPDFSSKKMPDYKIYTLSKVLEHNASPLLGLAFENLKRQMMNEDLDKRTSTSYIDVAYKETIDMRYLKKHNNKEIN